MVLKKIADECRSHKYALCGYALGAILFLVGWH